MKKLLYRLLLTTVVLLALLSTVTAITNIQFLNIYPVNQVTISQPSVNYSFRSIDFEFKTETIATFKSNSDEQKIAV